ncbi:MAG: hypothetical protein QGG48_12245, partial [Desulfatiglandales bacterium]|nr:hypothetical protein [Desulfatiglandales bacterium]
MNELTGKLTGNVKAAQDYIIAQELLTEARTSEEVADASAKAAIALNAIGDVNLAHELQQAGDNIDDMIVKLGKWSDIQGGLIKVQGAKAGMLGFTDREDEIERLLKARERDPDDPGLTAALEGATGNLARLFMDPTTFGRKKGEKGASAATIQGFFSDLFQGEGGMRGWSEKEIRGFLRQSFEGEEKLSETMVGELAAALETVLDPGAMEWEAEKALRDYVKSGEFGKFYARLRATQDKSLEEAAARASDAGNYTRQLEGILNRVGGIVLAYTEDLADIAEQTAVRQVTSQSRKGFLGFRGGMKNLEEARAVSAQDIGGRRQAMDRELFNQHINSILGLIKSEFLDIGRLNKAQRTVI